MELHLEENLAKRFDEMFDSRLDDSGPSRGKLDLLVGGFQDAVSQSSFQHDDSGSGTGGGAVGLQETGRYRPFGELRTRAGTVQFGGQWLHGP